MKVQMTLENKAYYDRLFKAMTDYCATLTDELKANYGLVSMPSEIKNLTTYYEWLDKMRGIENYDLFRVPVEEQEGFFEIDLNTRTIAVPSALKDGNVVIRPSSFKENGIGVQGDHAAEIIYFRCARFFDDMDLSLCRDNVNNPKGTQGACWIQWKRQGESEIHLSLAYNFDINMASDEDISNDTLIFGWILDDKATAVAGDLEFSVRFVQWDPTAPTNVGRDDPQELTYSLTTLSAKCKVHPSLSAEYNLGEIEVEKNLNSVVQKRKIYSGIYETAFGAYPVILSTGDLPLSANLQDYEDETYVDEEGNKIGAYHYYVTAYSPDNGTLSATWFQDIYGDNEEHVQVLDPEGKLLTVSEPELPGGNYTFGFTAHKAGSYYAVISNTNPSGTIRNTHSNGSTIEHASEFTLVENILPKAYIKEGTEFRVTPNGANGISESAPENDYNGVTYQWYIQETTGQPGEYDVRKPIEGATEAQFVPMAYLAEHPTAKLDGLLDCEATNMRNSDTLTIKSDSICELRAPATKPVFSLLEDKDENGKTKTVILDLSQETDMRDLTYNWKNFATNDVGNGLTYAPWAVPGSKFEHNQKVTVMCQVVRKIWPNTELATEVSHTEYIDITVP